MEWINDKCPECMSTLEYQPAEPPTVPELVYCPDCSFQLSIPDSIAEYVVRDNESL